MTERAARSPRPLAGALRRLADQLEPATTLAHVQAGWDAAAGPEFAARCRPIAVRDGVVTVICESAVWAQELDLRGPQIAGRLRAAGGLEDLEGLIARVGDPDSFP